jgi:hypothetical protein
MLGRVVMALWRGVKYVRQRGFWATFRRIIDTCTAGSVDFIVTQADLGGPDVSDRIGDIVPRPATLADRLRLKGIAHGTRQASVLCDHIVRGDWLFIACHDDRIVATRLIYASSAPERSCGETAHVGTPSRMGRR